MIFQPVLQASPTRHSWIITAHISLGNLECHWKLFKRQTIRTQQFLRSLEQYPSASMQLLTTLQLDLTNIQDIYKSNEATIISAINLLNSNQPQPITRCKRSLLPFLHTQLAHGNSHNQRYKQHQGQDQSTNCNTILTTQYTGAHHLHLKCHLLCHTSEQTQHQQTHRCCTHSLLGHRKSLQGYHIFSIQHFFQPDDITHQVSVCKPL